MAHLGRQAANRRAKIANDVRLQAKFKRGEEEGRGGEEEGTSVQETVAGMASKHIKAK